MRKHELDIVDIPVAPITDQFLEYLAVLEQIDVNAVGDFLEMASTLVEIKSRLLLPHADEVEDEIDDPRQELVRRLLEYKQFKDAASILDERAREWQERFPRQAGDLTAEKRDPADEPIRELELWGPRQRVRAVDSTASIPRSRRALFTTTRRSTSTWIAFISCSKTNHAWRSHLELFQPGMHKSTLIGMFLAVLELVPPPRLACRAKRSVRRDLARARSRRAGGCRPNLPPRLRLLHRQTQRARRQGGLTRAPLLAAQAVVVRDTSRRAGCSPVDLV